MFLIGKMQNFSIEIMFEFENILIKKRIAKMFLFYKKLK